MSDQGEADRPRPADVPATGARPERERGVGGDTWWGRLYDPDAPDTGGSGAADTIDDRFASARAVGASTTGSLAPAPPEEDAPGLVDGAPAPSPAPAPEAPAPAPPPAPTPPPGSAPPRTPAPSSASPDPVEAVDPLGDAGLPEAVDPAAPVDAVEAADPATDDAVPGDAPPRESVGRPRRAPAPPPSPRPAGRTRWRGMRGAFGPAVRPPGYAAAPRRLLQPPEPGVLADADPGALSDLVPDTVLDGARHASLVLRAVSARGGSARQRGEPRGDALLTACFGTGREALLFVAVAKGGPPGNGGVADGGGTGSVPAGRRAARELCQTIGEAVGRSRARLVEDIVTDRRATLSSGLKRLTDRCYGRLRAQAAALSLAPDAYRADLRCLLLPADPDCATRVVFGTGSGGLFRLRDGEWTDLEPVEEHAPPPPRRSAVQLPDPRLPRGEGDEEDGAEQGDGAAGRALPPPFRFRVVATEPGDALLLCSAGLAVPLRGDPAFADTLASRWAGADEPPAPATFLTDVQEPAPAYGDDRTAVAVWQVPTG
ncbi:protein phosphatase 2C domain-containing protein [Streptomyces sp. DSM 42041]|uniref:Protein phosphatase 2C domain-containing protein n=1 Tax=Streptomyces hazeniae TaxID=3075538 RepID=A0ABU2NTX5_9ACTN|nr:protein phosphatase 2C domain-containing protein [Streptomyces sp. DSM 42041]MDT0380439.1 protein phosphatase 2C domain-containing protein [Streptomyces sp. DSM 42041]